MNQRVSTNYITYNKVRINQPVQKKTSIKPQIYQSIYQPLNHSNLQFITITILIKYNYLSIQVCKKKTSKPKCQKSHTTSLKLTIRTQPPWPRPFRFRALSAKCNPPFHSTTALLLAYHSPRNSFHWGRDTSWHKDAFFWGGWIENKITGNRGKLTYFPSHLWLWHFGKMFPWNLLTQFSLQGRILYIYETDRIAAVHQPQWDFDGGFDLQWDPTNDGHGIYLYPLQLQLEQWKANCLELEIIEMECVIVKCCHLRTPK